MNAIAAATPRPGAGSARPRSTTCGTVPVRLLGRGRRRRRKRSGSSRRIAARGRRNTDERGATNGNRCARVRAATRNSTRRPTNSVDAGTTAATTVSPRSSRAARRGNLAIANPANEATSVPSGTAIAATRSEFSASGGAPAQELPVVRQTANRAAPGRHHRRRRPGRAERPEEHEDEGTEEERDETWRDRTPSAPSVDEHPAWPARASEQGTRHTAEDWRRSPKGIRCILFLVKSARTP